MTVKIGETTTFTVAELLPQKSGEEAGHPVVITYDYKVLKEDMGKTISNAVVGSAKDPEVPDPEEEKTETKVENPDISVEKTVISIVDKDGNIRQPNEGEAEVKAHLDDVITYQIVVKNTGNVKLNNVEVKDSLKDIIISDGTSLTIGDLDVNEDKNDYLHLYG